MFGLFKRKPAQVHKPWERRPACKHVWLLVDVETRWDVREPELYVVFTLACSKCNELRKVREYEFEQLKRYGFIKEGDAE